MGELALVGLTLQCTHIQHHMAQQHHLIYQSHYNTFPQDMGYTVTCWRYHPRYGKYQMDRAQDKNHWDKNVQEDKHR